MPSPTPPLSWLGTPLPTPPSPAPVFVRGEWSAHQFAVLDELRRAYDVTHDQFSSAELARLTFWRWLRRVGRLSEYDTLAAQARELDVPLC